MGTSGYVVMVSVYVAGAMSRSGGAVSLLLVIFFAASNTQAHCTCTLQFMKKLKDVLPGRSDTFKDLMTDLSAMKVKTA